jgi:hypothetical protein
MLYKFMNDERCERVVNFFLWVVNISFGIINIMLGSALHFFYERKHEELGYFELRK